jgi:CRISPR-associated protein Cmr3
MTVLVFSPLDTLFFRDGRPYNRMESNAQVVSQFPPFAPTLVGAARAAYARAMGWPDKNWDTTIRPHFGGGASLGPVSFNGPYLVKDGRCIFTVPACLVRTSDGQRHVLSPGPLRKCDLAPAGFTRLPASATGVGKYDPEICWITAQGMSALLNGHVPAAEDCVDDETVVQHERRVGNWRESKTRTVSEDNAIYSPTHVRLGCGVQFALVGSGLPDEIPNSPAPLGGESRMVSIVRTDQQYAMPSLPDLRCDKDLLNYAVVLITPLDIADSGWPRPNVGYAGLPGHVVSACLKPVQRAGGWLDTTVATGGPQALRPLLPAGCVLFMQTVRDQLEAVVSLHGSKIGARTEWGFGQILIGAWGV